jgi:hypothetical protein
MRILNVGKLHFVPHNVIFHCINVYSFQKATKSYILEVKINPIHQVSPLMSILFMIRNGDSQFKVVFCKFEVIFGFFVTLPITYANNKQ